MFATICRVLTRPTNARTPSRRGQTARRRLSFEPLEQRTLLAILPVNPGQSIQAVVNTAGPGDTVLVRSGTYAEAVDTVRAGREDAWISIVADPGVVIDGTDEGPSAPTFDVRHSYTRFQGFDIRNSRAGFEIRPGVHHVEIVGATIRRTDFGILLGNRDAPQVQQPGSIAFVTVRDVWLLGDRDNGPRGDGLRTDAVGQNFITDINNIVLEDIQATGYAYAQSNGFVNGDGIILEPGTHGVTIRNVTSFGNGDAGMDIKAHDVVASGVVLYENQNNLKTWGNNIVINVGLAYRPTANNVNARNGSLLLNNVTLVDGNIQAAREVSSWPPAHVVFQNSIVAKRTGGTRVATEGGATYESDHTLWYFQGQDNPANDPRFVNWSGDDFHLRADSPAVDYGDSTLVTSPYDLDGNPRVAGTAVDAGAYELQTDEEPWQPTFAGLAEGDVVQGVIMVAPVQSAMPPISEVTYYVDGVFHDRQTISPFALGGGEGYDTRNAPDGSHTLSGTVTAGGVQKPYSITFTVDNVQEGAQMTGLQDGQTVSGTIFVGPDLNHHPDVRKAHYYLDGTQYGRVYISPFYWGGPTGTGTGGFDTTTLPNDSFTLSGFVTTSARDVPFTPIRFTVANEEQEPSGASMVGLANGQTVSGTIYFGPNLNVHRDVRKAHYYLNGTQYGRVYQSPFYFGGPTGNGTGGFQTSTLPDGEYVLSGFVTVASGDLSFTPIRFIVDNVQSTSYAAATNDADEGSLQSNRFQPASVQDVYMGVALQQRPRQRSVDAVFAEYATEQWAVA